MQKLKRRIKARLKLWKTKRFFKKHRVNSYREFRLVYDTDISKCASSISSYYHGYQYVHAFTNRDNDFAYKCVYDYGPGGNKYGYDTIRNWCDTHLANKWRVGIHRVTLRTYNGVAFEFEFDDCFGWDTIFFVFQNERDYIWFKLRWE